MIDRGGRVYIPRPGIKQSTNALLRFNHLLPPCRGNVLGEVGTQFTVTPVHKLFVNKKRGLVVFSRCAILPFSSFQVNYLWLLHLPPRVSLPLPFARSEG